jgi:hypothetical protein
MICGSCRVGLHDACMGAVKICMCPECFVDEDSTEDEDD